MKRFLIVVAVVLVLAPGAAAGGWATVQLSAVPQDGIEAGTTLGIDITVLQHGRTPLAGVTPVFQVRDLSSGRIVGAVKGRPTGRIGVYHVDVSFPRAGSYAYQVYDGFEAYGGAQTHTYASIEVAAPRGSGLPSWVGAALGAVLLLAVASVAAIVLGVRRGSSRRQATARAVPAGEVTPTR